MPEYSFGDPAVLAFIVIPVALVAALAWATRSLGVLIGGAAWMGAWWMAAASGLLRQWDRTPPPFALLVLGVMVMSVLIAYGPYGKRLALGVPLWTLVAVQGFRLPLELAMHALVDRGIMPAQMSYSGQNFDIVTGITALVVAAILKTGRGRWLAIVWNAMGVGLLVNVVTIAILSTPVFQYFGSDRLNVFVTYPPFVWLPAVMVVAALAGHLLVARALLLHPRQP